MIGAQPVKQQERSSSSPKRQQKLAKLVIKFISQNHHLTHMFLVATIPIVVLLIILLSPMARCQKFFQPQHFQSKPPLLANDNFRHFVPQQLQLQPQPQLYNQQQLMSSQREALEHLVRTNYHNHLHHRHVPQQAQQRVASHPADRRTSSSSAQVEQTHADGDKKLLVCYYTTRQTTPYWPKDAREYASPPEGAFVSPANDPQQQVLNDQHQTSSSNFMPLLHYEPFVGSGESRTSHSLLQQPPVDFVVPVESFRGTHKSQPQALKFQTRQQQLIFKSAVPQFVAMSQQVPAIGKSGALSNSRQTMDQRQPQFYQSLLSTANSTNAGGQQQLVRMASPAYNLLDADDTAATNNGVESLAPFVAGQTTAPNNGIGASADNFIVNSISTSAGYSAGNNGNYQKQKHPTNAGKQSGNNALVPSSGKMRQQLAPFPSHLSRAVEPGSFVMNGGGGSQENADSVTFSQINSASQSGANTNTLATIDTKSHSLVPSQHNNYRQATPVSTSTATASSTTAATNSPPLYQQQREKQLDELQHQQQQHQLSPGATASNQMQPGVVGGSNVPTANSLSLDAYSTFQDINKLQPQQPFLTTTTALSPQPAAAGSDSADQRSPTTAANAPVGSNGALVLLTSAATARPSSSVHSSSSAKLIQQHLYLQQNRHSSHPSSTNGALSATTPMAASPPPTDLGGKAADMGSGLPLQVSSTQTNGAVASLVSSSTPKNSHLLHQPQTPPQQQSKSASALQISPQPTSLSSALVSSPLSTMFDVFGAASQYLMRFKPSSLISPGSFASQLNSMAATNGQQMEEHARLTHLGANQHLSGGHGARIPLRNSSFISNMDITKPPDRPIDRSSGSAGLSNSIGSGMLARLTGSSNSNQRREDVCGRTIQMPERRIIGGEGARYGEFPYQVHIKIAKHQCGGALVDRQSIVTAAHCVYHFITRAPVSKLQIVIGAYDIEDEQYQELPPQYFKVNKVKLHPNFRFSASHPDRYDIAILKLDKPVKYTDNVLPVCLPGKDLKFEHMVGTVTGFGKTDPSLSNRYGTRLLQKVDVPIIENNECERWHRTRGIDLKIFPEMMCAGYEDGLKDACVGDSGGPLVVKTAAGPNGSFRWTLAGITSAGFGCAQSRQPGIYHRVSHTVDWILENLD